MNISYAAQIPGLTIILGAGWCEAKSFKGSRPDSIFIFADDWGYGDLSVLRGSETT